MKKFLWFVGICVFNQVSLLGKTPCEFYYSNALGLPLKKILDIPYNLKIPFQSWWLKRIYFEDKTYDFLYYKGDLKQIKRMKRNSIHLIRNHSISLSSLLNEKGRPIKEEYWDLQNQLISSFEFSYLPSGQIKSKKTNSSPELLYDLNPQNKIKKISSSSINIYSNDSPSGRLKTVYIIEKNTELREFSIFDNKFVSLAITSKGKILKRKLFEKQKNENWLFSRRNQSKETIELFSKEGLLLSRKILQNGKVTKTETREYDQKNRIISFKTQALLGNQWEKRYIYQDGKLNEESLWISDKLIERTLYKKNRKIKTQFDLNGNPINNSQETLL